MSAKWRSFALLHALLLLYSLNGVVSKMAAREQFLSWQFVGLYAFVIAILGVYALGWQQVLKRMPLSTAYANKAITVVWACILGMVVFHEQLTLGRMAGMALVFAGVVTFGLADGGGGTRDE